MPRMVLLGAGGRVGAWITEALAWQTAVIANSGTVSAGTLSAVQDFLEDLHIAEIRTKILRLNLFAGDQLDAALVPQIRDAGTASADTNTNFVSGDYTETTGLNPGASNSTKYLTTGLAPLGLLSLASASQGFWMANTDTGNDRRCIGAYESTSASMFLMPLFGTFRIANMFDSTTGRSQHTPITDSAGLLSSSRVASNDHRIYMSGVQVGSTSSGTPTSTAPNANVLVFWDGNGSGKSGRRSYGYFIGTGLTTSDMANLNNAWSAFNAAMSRV